MRKGLPPNPFQVVIVGLDKKTTLKSVLQDILIQMKDPDWMIGTEKQLRERIRNFVVELGVELIVIDECQHLHKDGNDVADVTDALKRLLDLGVAPLVLVGNFDAKAVFNRNPQLRARLGLPMYLPAINPKNDAEAIHFRNFVLNFGIQLENCKAVTCSQNLIEATTLEALRIASTGYFGRVSRILKAAAAHAAARGAKGIEDYDLSCVVRELAIPSKWVDCDPFSA
ncbi:TniB family NTP-binding protein [Sphingomonas floccifaciens]|uniref:TniB family NTP-binding protein n=1 Tax=Sphingomonas floccifaciens TaxID=1844115 RepID=A0ABW4NEI3_9SPHN